ncbi:MAG: efflux RND transporter periplasmic adaptor subunit [Gammaproteobacteria bacterium]|nr:efflux RND transporter periplasmic adaptor subunit [Gammaproteobacteria bacterium]
MIKKTAHLKTVLRTGVMVTGLACLVFAGCSKEEAPVESKQPRPVKTIVLEDSGAAGMRQYPGRVRAASRADLSFEVAGKLIELSVKEGQVVGEGELIARLDDRDLSANLKSAQAEADNAAANFARGAKLVKDGFISKTDFDTLTSKRDVTAAELVKAKKAVEDTKLLAPFSGRVANRLVENFQDVQAKQPIVRLQDIEQLEVLVEIPENRAIRIRDKGKQEAKAHAVFEASPGREFPLTIKEFSTEANPETQTFEVVLAMPQPEGLMILPGMTAMVWAESAEAGSEAAADSFVIPAVALFADEDGKSQVWVVDTQTNTVQKRSVETGDLEGTEGVRVTSGLKAGEMLAVSAVSRLREGMAIVPIDKVEF